MKILQISAADISGGAARAAYRLHNGLRASGIDSLMMVQNKDTEDDTIIGPAYNLTKGLALIKTTLDHLPKVIYRKKKETVFHLQWLPDFKLSKIRKQMPDIVHLHWIYKGFINLKTLAHIKEPIVWTLHDMWPFTGGCHYAGDCKRYENSCGYCPQLGSNYEKDFSRWTWWRKKTYWKNLNLTIVTPSKWLKKYVLKSSLLCDSTVEVIPNGIDLTRFRPFDRNLAREYLGLPKDKQLILFGALKPVEDPRKGFQLLLPAIDKISSMDSSPQIELIILGAAQHTNPPDFKLKTTYLGRLYDDISIAAVYAACDAFVIPSVEDNLPNTVMEALACGTPCVGFNTGGIPEMIKHEKNGYIAASFDTNDLANGIMWILQNEKRWHSLSREARKTAEMKYDINIVAKRYAKLYQNILA